MGSTRTSKISASTCSGRTMHTTAPVVLPSEEYARRDGYHASHYSRYSQKRPAPCLSSGTEERRRAVAPVHQPRLRQPRPLRPRITRLWPPGSRLPRYQSVRPCETRERGIFTTEPILLYSRSPVASRHPSIPSLPCDPKSGSHFPTRGIVHRIQQIPGLQHPFVWTNAVPGDGGVGRHAV